MISQVQNIKVLSLGRLTSHPLEHDSSRENPGHQISMFVYWSVIRNLLCFTFCSFWISKWLKFVLLLKLWVWTWWLLTSNASFQATCHCCFGLNLFLLLHGGLRYICLMSNLNAETVNSFLPTRFGYVLLGGNWSVQSLLHISWSLSTFKTMSFN